MTLTQKGIADLTFNPADLGFVSEQNRNGTAVVLSTNSLAGGIYFAEVTTVSGREIKKIVKQ